MPIPISDACSMALNKILARYHARRSGARIKHRLGFPETGPAAHMFSKLTTAMSQSQIDECVEITLKHKGVMDLSHRDSFGYFYSCCTRHLKGSRMPDRTELSNVTRAISLTGAIRARAHELGFSLFGAESASRPPWPIWVFTRKSTTHPFLKSTSPGPCKIEYRPAIQRMHISDTGQSFECWPEEVCDYLASPDPARRASEAGCWH